MKKTMFVFIGLVVCLLCTVATGTAGVPQMINFQGRLTNAQGDTLSGDYSVRFRIYADSSGTIVLWEESWLTTEDHPVKVRGGIFNVLLGSRDSIPDTVFTGSTRWLGMKVEGDPEMEPLQPIASVGYAFHSATSDTARTATPDGDWVIDGDNIYHEQGNVGIGTANPKGKLHVRYGLSGASRFVGDGAIFESGANGWWAVYTPNTGAGGLMVSDPEDFDEARLYYTHTDNSWRIDGNGTTELVRITSNGNVGIGTTEPDEELHVVGNIKMVDGNQAAGKVLTSDASGVGTWQPVSSGIPSGVIVIWSGSIGSIPEGWALCDGTSGTPDLRDRFIVAAGSSYNVGDTGGEAFHTLTINEMPSHTHTMTFYNHGGGPGTPDGAQHTDPYTLTSNPTGGDQPHENRPPYYALAYIMKL